MLKLYLSPVPWNINIAFAMATLFQSLVTNALTTHFMSYLTPNQHAYIEGRSTTTNLVDFVHLVNETLCDNSKLDVY